VERVAYARWLHFGARTSVMIASRHGEAPVSHCAPQLAEAACGLRGMRMPEEVVVSAQLHLLDALGVALAAASLRTGPGIHRAVRILGQGAEATALGLAQPLPAPAAALLNGSLIHGLEYDDTHMGAVVHASAVVAPVALAIAERDGASGEALLEAFVLGWEALARGGLASPGGFHARGFQGTAVLGAPVAALVAGWLMGQEANTLAHAMGIAGSQSSGIFEFVSDGATVKMLHGGWPAHAGILAAALAGEGLTGPAAVFEGERGLFRAFTDDAGAGERFARQVQDLGQRWLLQEVAFKPYPCCHYLQAAVEAVQQIHAAGVEAAEVAEVECELPQEVAWLVCEPLMQKLAPPSGHVAKFSLHYCLAVTLTRGRLEVGDFDRAEVDTALLPLMQRVRYRPMPGSGFPARYAARVRVRTQDGTWHERTVLDVKGTPQRPFSRDDVLAKFRGNAARVLDAEGVEAVIEAVDGLAQAPDIQSLSTALRRVAG
jgi:2-methylcitrate dehydratase PrpD